MKNTYTALLSLFLLITACKKEIKFQTTDNGLEYAFITRNDTAQKANYGDAVVIDMKFYWNDSLMFDTKEFSLDYRMKLDTPRYKGSIYEGMAMMHVGDSAIFRIDAFNFYQITAGMNIPSCIKQGDKLTFYVKLLDVLTPEELQYEYERNKKLKQKNEKKLLKDYLELNNITVEPTESGLYFISIKKGTGPKPQIGDSVTVHYEGRLINNQIFDSSINKNRPFTFVLGDTNLIEGWNEGIAMMREGGVAQLIIPSHLAYGEYGIGEVIPPYSTLIFEIHLLKVKHN